jgi:hypothetical protein
MRGTIADRNVALHLAIRILPVSEGSDTEASRRLLTLPMPDVGRLRWRDFN